MIIANLIIFLFPIIQAPYPDANGMWADNHGYNCNRLAGLKAAYDKFGLMSERDIAILNSASKGYIRIPEHVLDAMFGDRPSNTTWTGYGYNTYFFYSVRGPETFRDYYERVIVNCECFTKVEDKEKQRECEKELYRTNFEGW